MLPMLPMLPMLAMLAMAGLAQDREPQVVVRPEPGLARGLWEAPPWVFIALLGAVAVAALGWAAATFLRRRIAR
jgi:hypothetical protein